MADSYGRSALKHLVPVKEQRCRILPSPAQELLNKLILSDWGTHTGRISGIAVDGVVWFAGAKLPFWLQAVKNQTCLKPSTQVQVAAAGPDDLIEAAFEHYSSFGNPQACRSWSLSWYKNGTSLSCLAFRKDFNFFFHISGTSSNVCAHWIIHPVPSCLFGIVTSLAQGSNLKVEDFTAASLKYVLLLQLRSKTNMLISWIPHGNLRTKKIWDSSKSA